MVIRGNSWYNEWQLWDLWCMIHGNYWINGFINDHYHHLMLVGGWLGHPSEKYDFVNWDDHRNPIVMGIWENRKLMATKPPTRMYYGWDNDETRLVFYGVTRTEKDPAQGPKGIARIPRHEIAVIGRSSTINPEYQNISI